MYTSVLRPYVNYSNAIRWCARTSGAFLMVSWFALFITDAMRQGLGEPELNTHGQAVALAIVFAGYVLGWWKEFAGGVLAVVGTFAFFAVVAITDHTPPEPSAVWFAAPGILYLLSYHYNERRNERLTRQP